MAAGACALVLLLPRVVLVLLVHGLLVLVLPRVLLVLLLVRLRLLYAHVFLLPLTGVLLVLVQQMQLLLMLLLQLMHAQVLSKRQGCQHLRRQTGQADARWSGMFVL